MGRNDVFATEDAYVLGTELCFDYSIKMVEVKRGRQCYTLKLPIPFRKVNPVYSYFI